MTKTYAARQLGQSLFQLQEIVDTLKDLVLSTGLFARVNMDELRVEAIDKSIRQKLVAAAIWAQWCEPEGPDAGTGGWSG